MATRREIRAGGQGSPALPPALYFLLVFATGTGVMVVELLGPRVLAATFGSSLIVWTAVITLTLVALAVGYRWGGVLADRRPEPRPVFALIGVAGAWCVLILVLANPVLLATAGLREEVGAIVASLILFVPPITLLAMVGPYVIRLLTQQVENVGHRAGAVYAVSTVGSVVGSIATGYWLIPHVGIRAVLLSVGLLLVAIAVAGLLATRGRRAATTVVVLAALACAGVAVRSSARAAALAAEGFVVPFEASSAYAEVKVVDWVRPEQPQVGRRMLYIGLGAHTVVANGSVNESYVRALHLIPGLRPAARTACVIGLGGGAIPHVLEAYGYSVDSVEIDPLVVDAARRWFGAAESATHRIHVLDGRRYLRETDRRFDVIVNDAFGSGTAPFHLFSREMLELTRERLAPGGLFVVNYLGFSEAPYDRGVASALRTLQASFAHVRAVAGTEDDPAAKERLVGAEGRTFSNFVFFASDEPVDLKVPTRLAVSGPPPTLPYLGPPLPLQVTGDAVRTARLRRQLAGLLALPVVVDPARGVVLTDDRNPLDVYNVFQNRMERRFALKLFRPIFLGSPSPGA